MSLIKETSIDYVAFDITYPPDVQFLHDTREVEPNVRLAHTRIIRLPPANRFACRFTWGIVSKEVMMLVKIHTDHRLPEEVAKLSEALHMG